MEKIINLKYRNRFWWKSWSKTVRLPAKGKFVNESHYLTNIDTVKPKHTSDQIDNHLLKSINILNEYLKPTHPYKIEDIYKQKYQKVWTPAEGGGNIGANATDGKTDLWAEMWQGNMMFASYKEMLLARGKYLITNPINKKSSVIQMGYEIGPPEEYNLGGITTEVHWWLKSTNDTILELSYLDDQSKDLGPVLVSL